MIEILFRAEVKAAERSVFIDFIEWDARVAKEDERGSGTLWFDYYEDPEDRNAFFVYEAYQDEMAFDAHKRNAPFKRWEAYIKQNVLTEFQILFESGKVVCSSKTLMPHEEAALKSLNEQFAVMEQQRDAEAKAWFDIILSDHLIFRCANESMVDKQGFLESLDDLNPFASRYTDDVHFIALDNRALVFLIVCTTKADGIVYRYRNIRLFSKVAQSWKLDRWRNYDITNV